MPDLGTTLLTLARNAIAAHFGLQQTPAVDCPELHKMGASFVTLTQQGQLRGCVGCLEAWRTLAQDVHENALAAAFRDPRFNPLSADELPLTRVEVSLLTPAEPLSFTSEADALAQLRPEIDGVILTAGHRRATFLPQVWEQLAEPAEFMARLKQKAGLPVGYWGPDVHLERYAVMKWKEAAP
jgi:AmmeMemoRadiSam system protein A